MDTRKIALVEKFDPSIHIISKTDWMYVSELRGAKHRISKAITEKNGTNGVYQIALAKDVKDINDKIIAAGIGYTGKSTNIFGRLYALKMHKHSASPYIRTAFDIKDVMVRILFVDGVENLDTVERSIHDATEKEYGYRFAWKEASAGIDGLVMKIQDHIDRIESIDSLRDLAQYIDDRAMEILAANWRQKED